MTEYHWLQVRDHATELFGETPSAQLEADVLEEFDRRPSHVAQLVDRIGAKVQAGKIRSGWAVLRKELLAAPGPDRVATDEAERDKRIRNAKRWIDNAGLHFDRQDHVEAELFGDEYARGPLASFDTPELRAELVAYWQQQRPRGEQAERDHIAWNETAKANRAILQPKRQTSANPSSNRSSARSNESHTSPTQTASPESDQPSTRSSDDSTQTEPSEDIDFTPEPTFATSEANG